MILSSIWPLWQYYLLFCPTVVPLPQYYFLFNPVATPSWQKIYLAPRLHLSRQNPSCNPSGLFASNFLQAALVPIPTWFFKASVHWHWCCFSCNAMQWTAFCILSDAHSRLPFISVGVAFVATPWTNSLMHLSNAHSHSIDTFLLGDASWVGIYIWVSKIDLMNWLC